MLLSTAGPDKAGEFLAGWATEYSLSVDNLFVFVIIMSRFAVPRDNQQKVLLVGIILSLLLRGACILLGAAAIEAFSWVFYLFGGFLVYTAVQLLRSHGAEQEEYRENVADPARPPGAAHQRPLRRGPADHPRSTPAGVRRMLTPMVVVLLAIGSTDVLFALDSIPAIFGLTQDPFIVFTATLFALMGLRQLYFLLGGLLDRLVYLSQGLSVILAFIGVKLILEALALERAALGERWRSRRVGARGPDLAVLVGHRRRARRDHRAQPRGRPAARGPPGGAPRRSRAGRPPRVSLRPPLRRHGRAPARSQLEPLEPRSKIMLTK